MSGKKNNEYIKKVKAVREQKPLPDWYDGAKYVQWDTVENRFTGDKALLSPNEVAMYDLIMGAEHFGQWELMRKGLDWFRTAYAKAYMILLD